MHKDPLTQWEDGFPYDLLAPSGVGPSSTMRQIRDASFALMAQGAMTPQVRRAWDTLRRPERRLVVDFFMCQQEWPELEAGEEADAGGNDAGQAIS